MGKQRTKLPSKITPLWIIATFVTLTETVLSFALTQVAGGVQIALTTFVIFYALLVASAFFVILWNRPYVFYSPSEFGETDPKTFIEAMRGQLPERVVEQLSMVERIEASPGDQTAQFALINSLIDEPVRQHLILMHEKNVTFTLSEFGWHRYETGTAGSSWAGGGMSGKDLCKKLDGTGLISVTTKGPSVELTDMGHRFAQWLIDSGEKAEFLQTPFGGWGTAKRPDGMPPAFYGEILRVEEPPSPEAQMPSSSEPGQANKH